MSKTILALGSLLPAEMEDLEARFDVIRLWRENDPEQILQTRRNDVVAILSTYLTPVRRRLIEALPNLEIIAQFGAGTDNIDLDVAAARNIAVTNTPDILTGDTADTALALVLATSRRICEADMYVRIGKWANGPMGLGTSLGGKTAGIVGLGRIGQAIARRLAAFDMHVAYHGPREKDDQPYTYYESLADMAADCDFLILACSGGEDTAGIVDYNILEKLGPRGYLINVARGSVVVEDDLLAALSNRAIAGAGLDVYADEPHVPDALFKMDNVVLLPHIGSATVETRTAMGRLVLDNLSAHFEGQPLKTPVAA